MNNYKFVKMGVFLLLNLFFVLSIEAHSAEKEAVPALTMEDLANASLCIRTGGEREIEVVKLKDGHYERDIEGVYSLSVNLTKWTQFNDLDKDGALDAVVIYVWSAGGSEYFYELAAFLNKNGNPLHVSSEALGDRVVIRSMDIHSDTVLLDMLTQGKGDANCCPTLEVKLRYRFQAGEMLEQTDYVGVYEGEAVDTAGVHMQVRLYINQDKTAKIIIHYSDWRTATTKYGEWVARSDGSMLVDFTGGDPRGTDLIYFRFLNNKLTSMLHFDEIYGKGDLEFERVSP